MKLAPYPEYKDSGVKWLGKIPAHWDCLPHRAVFSEVKDQGHIDEPLLSVTITKGIIPQSQLLANSSKKDSSNLDKSKYKLVCPNDITYNKMRAWQGAIGVSKYRGIVSPAYIVVRLRRPDDPNYFHYLLRTPSFAKEAERWSYGITPDMWSLRPEHFKLIYSCIPQNEEQIQIAGFLDWKKAQINKFIRSKRQLIELLKEQKQSVINQAVTRGLDPNVKLKASGVEWIEDIPEHWEVIRLKHCISRIEQGWSPQCDAQSAGENEWGVLKVGCVNGDFLDTTQNKKLPDNLNPLVSLSIKAGDILVSRANTRELLGLAALATKDFPFIMLCDKLFRFRARNSRAYPEYLVKIIRCPSSRAQIESSTNGASSSMQNIGQGVIWNLWISLPSISDQKRILSHILEITKEIDQTIYHAQREIELIREYRTRLISDVVTGQVDVRGIEVPEVAEEELLDLNEDNGESDDMIEEEVDMDGTD